MIYSYIYIYNGIVIKYIYGYNAKDKINIAPVIDRISGKKYSFADCQLNISLKAV